MNKITLTYITLTLFLISCQNHRLASPVENNQHIYYGKLEKVKFVVIKKKTSIKDVAQKYSVPINEIRRLNSLLPHQGITIGQVLKIPLGEYHIIKDNESAREIAEIYDVSLQTLLRENYLSRENQLSSGQYVRIPSNSGDYKEDSDNGHVIFTKSDVHPEKTKQTRSVKKDTEVKYIGNKLEGFKNRTPLNNDYFIWPLYGKVIKRYGNVNGKLNDSISIAATKGTNILSVADGEVIFVGFKPEKFGNLVIIKHKNAYMSAYSHCDTILVSKNEVVRKGSIIATCGSSGNVTESQLQFTFKKGNHVIDPDS
jgi:murein DD-endopeptidase MepM/ murein hydrolase activator NlpD